MSKPSPSLMGLRVCFVAGTLGQGGAERQLCHILELLQEAGARVTLLCLTQGEFWENKIAGLGVPCIWVGRRRNRLWRLWRIYSEIRRLRPSIVQSQHFYTNFYAAVAARLLGIPSVGAIRNDLHLELAANGRILGRLCLWLPDLIGANSAVAVGNAEKTGIARDRLWLIPNTVDTVRFHPAPGPAEFRILSIGSLKPVKRFDLVLNAVASLRRKGIAVSAVLAGDGPLREQLARQAVDLGIAGAVEFSGAVADVAPLYRQASVFVLASDHEGTPNVILEAMASGLPVVATAVGGVPALISSGESGFLVPAGRQDELNAALEKIAADKMLGEKLGARARSFVEANHTSTGVVRALEGIYRAALGARLDLEIRS